MTEKSMVPLVEGLFTWPSDEPRLIASKCRRCGTVAFPKAAFCPNPDCPKDSNNVEEALLSRRGKVWTWTVQRYPPPPPFKYEPFAQYAIGMVDLPEGLRVLGIITSHDVDIGSEVEITVGKLWEDDDKQYVTWMWQPVKAGRHA